MTGPPIDVEKPGPVGPGPAGPGPAPTAPGPGAPPAPWPPPGATLAAQAVSKSFGSLVAVSDVTFAVGPGVTALLGPNGAGKSTLIRLLCGLTPPSTGRVWVAGGDPRRDRRSRARIGLVPQQDGVFERERALDVVALAATLSHLPDPIDRARAALNTVELDPDEARPVGAYSKGMRQRVKIAQAIVHGPEVVVLDEPLNGLDPRQRRAMIELFQRLGAEGRTVLVSSHVLEEVERFGSDVVVVARGRLAAQGDFRAIRDLMDDQPRRIRIGCDRAPEVAALLLQWGSITGCTVLGASQLEVTSVDARTFRRHLPAACHRLGIRLHDVTPLDEDLDSVFRYLVGGPQV